MPADVAEQVLVEDDDLPREIFEQVAVNPESGMDPGVLYGRYEPASGHPIERRTLREPVTTAG